MEQNHGCMIQFWVVIVNRPDITATDCKNYYEFC